MDSNIQALKKVTIFSMLDEQDLIKIASVAVERSYQKNRVIFSEGDIGNVLFILLSGMVKIFVNDKTGREVILKIMDENDFFGEMSILDGNYRSATIVALKGSKALLISKDDLVSLIRHHPSIAFNIMAALSRRLRKADDKIASLSFLDAYGKVAKVLLEFAAVIGKQDGDHIVIDIPVSRREMAETAGVARETFARILSKYVSKGCLEIKGKKIVILDHETLKKKATI